MNSDALPAGTDAAIENAQLSLEETLSETACILSYLEMEIKRRDPKAFAKPEPKRYIKYEAREEVAPIPEDSVNPDAAKKLAEAVVMQALDDLNPRTPLGCMREREVVEARESAKKFLLRDLWRSDCVWGAYMREAKASIVAEANRRIALLEIPTCARSGL